MYNGYKNYETWNIALWIQNDESLYGLSRTCRNYAQFVETMRLCSSVETPDKVAWNDSGLDIDTLNELF